MYWVVNGHVDVEPVVVEILLPQPLCHATYVYKYKLQYNCNCFTIKGPATMHLMQRCQESTNCVCILSCAWCIVSCTCIYHPPPIAKKSGKSGNYQLTCLLITQPAGLKKGWELACSLHWNIHIHKLIVIEKHRCALNVRMRLMNLIIVRSLKSSNVELGWWEIYSQVDKPPSLNKL